MSHPNQRCNRCALLKKAVIQRSAAGDRYATSPKSTEKEVAQRAGPLLLAQRSGCQKRCAFPSEVVSTLPKSRIQPS
ncbi:hypothetical protein PCANC_28272 [Puccinia coronata f. sp. avenae]|uniref:Uncharacterized protein n=1 Tax=Puccinia coronata f. sp. avenae TaxID=200324 RepID=A0A2N5RYE9_9BASI|nr:hypothetical protein PCANC_28272 [Puccinia coronata f. sp. avenae]